MSLKDVARIKRFLIVILLKISLNSWWFQRPRKADDFQSFFLLLSLSLSKKTSGLKKRRREEGQGG